MATVEPRLVAGDFRTAAVQLSQFTPDEELATVKVLPVLLAKWGTFFDGLPITLPVPTSLLPREIPRITLQSSDAQYKCEVSSERIAITWQRTDIDKDLPSDFPGNVLPILNEYSDTFGARVGRLGLVHVRFAQHRTPGLFLARHFCKERWDRAPLNRPDNFELHAHKQFLLRDKFTVNSWMRNKSGVTPNGPAVLVEQDLNTLVEEITAATFSGIDVRTYFDLAFDESNSILELYYPRGET